MKLTKLLIPTLLLSAPFALAQQVTPPPSADLPDSEVVGSPAEPGLPDDALSDPLQNPDSEMISTIPVGAPTLPSGDGLDDVPPPPPPPVDATGDDSAALDENGDPIGSPIEESDGGFLIRDAALNDIFQMLAKKAGKQYFHNARIAGPDFSVSGHLNGGDPLQQMEELAFQYSLTLYQKGRTVYALNAEQLRQLPASEWHYQLAYLRPTDIEQIKALIMPMLSPGTGIVNFEPKTNTIVVIDSSHHVEMAKEFLMSIDQAKGQITVEVKILSVLSKAAERTGVDWSSSLGEAGVPLEVAKSLNSLFGIDSVTEATGLTTGDVLAFGETSSNSVVLGPAQINGVLRALAEGGLVRQLSNPTLITEDNELATISIIDRVPIITTTVNQTSSGSNETEEVRYQIDEKDPVGDPATTREIGVTLAVTPTLLPDGTIRMKMRPRSAQITGLVIGQSGNSYPRVSESMIESIARIPDGYSLLVGGFYGEVKKKGSTKVPILGDIPVINFFFKSKAAEKETASLVFVVTPTSYDPSIVAQNCRTSKKLRSKLSLSNEHDWVDDANPGVAHLPDLDRTLRGMDPRRERYRDPVENYQVDLENCDDCNVAPKGSLTSAKGSRRTMRRKR
jgi:type II secretory pathway component GspD/PulD (secretin)